MTSVLGSPRFYKEKQFTNNFTESLYIEDDHIANHCWYKIQTQNIY